MDQNTETGNETTTAEQQSPGRARRILKKTGKVIAVTSAMDVLAKDLKRVRPRNPDLWKQVFSREGWARLKQKVASPKQVEQKPAKSSGVLSPAWRNLLNAAATAAISYTVGIYSVRVTSTIATEPAMKALPLFAGVCFMFIAIIYTAIALKIAAGIRKSSKHHSKASRQSKTPGDSAPSRGNQ
jgi:hypothetical protein